MRFEDLLDQTIDMLQRRGRVTYRALQLQFHLDDETLDVLKDELIDGQQLAVDEERRVLVWTGSPPAGTPSWARQEDSLPQAPSGADVLASAAAHPTPLANAERRQLTVLFCDLVESTALASQLDPEDWRQVVRAYQTTCAESIQRFGGHIAQYLGDGLLVYFGYPHAHEDDAQRAVRTGLAIVKAMGTLNGHLEQQYGVRLAVRLGIHTGLVVVGEVGGRGRLERLALGETPNMAARIQGSARPNSVAISVTTYRLVEGYFTCEALETQHLQGVLAPLPVYRILGESATRSRLDIARTRGLTPLVGREYEVELLLDRWAQVKEGRGQVILFSGEPGIGKSRLVQFLKDAIAFEPHSCWECRSSPYYQHTALYPLTEFFQRALQWQPEDTPEEKVGKLAQALRHSRLPVAESVPLLASLLSLPLPAEQYPGLNLSPQRQRQKTLESIVAILMELAARQPVLFILEDVHWTDPTTLELLALLLDQTPLAALCMVLTSRPMLQPPWQPRSYCTQVTLNRLSPSQIEQMAQHVAGGKGLPFEVLQQLVEKTDGVPLFVEEMTKAILETGILKAHDEGYELTAPLPAFATPVTLQDSLMARLDRLLTAKGIAQLGATLGRHFSYGLLQAVASVEEDTLQTELRRLVETELLYQSGVPPQATYTFKHALIQEVAYQSLLKSTRQQYHQRVAQALETHFPDTVDTQPELLAHHYTEAGVSSAAVTYWHRAGQRASQRSSNVEAIAHLTQGLEVLGTLPNTPERTRYELMLLLSLGVALIAAKGYAAPEVEDVYTHARTLCQEVAEAPQLLRALLGLEAYYVARAELQTAHALAEQCLLLAQRQQNPVRLLNSHHALGLVLLHRGEPAPALQHLEQGITLYDAQPQHPPHNLQNPGVACRSYAAWALWCLGYPEQALQRNRQALALAHTLSHPYSLAYVRCYAAGLHLYRREAQRAQEQAAAAMALATEHALPLWGAMGTWLYGWALADQGHRTDGIAHIRQGLKAWQATGAALTVPAYLATLAAAYGQEGQWEEALALVQEALALVQDSGERFWEAELYRLKGALLLQTPAAASQAEACFQQALSTASRQQAKALELRAATSLGRLWQAQGKQDAAHALLAPIYHWFTEGCDTADLQEARAFLEQWEA